MTAFYQQWQRRQVLRELNFLATIDIDNGQRFGLRSFEPTSAGEYSSCEVDCVETTVEWEQWAVADSHFE